MADKSIKLPPRHTLAEVVAFLCGEAPLEGVWFGEKHPLERGAFWWRPHLRAAVAALKTAGANNG
jgi:hypothetical protein